MEEEENTTTRRCPCETPGLCQRGDGALYGLCHFLKASSTTRHVAAGPPCVRVLLCLVLMWVPRGVWEGGGGGCHKASVSDCLPLAAPIGLSPLLILTLCGSERVLVVSTEPPDDLSCLTTPGVGRPRDGLLPVLLTRGIPMHTPSPCGGLPTPALT